MSEWVSFDDVKSRVSLLEILDRYDLTGKLRRRKNELIGLCPFHRETKGSFSANTVKQAWKCFGCGRGGNLFDFVIAMGDADDIRGAALLIDKWFPDGSQRPGDTPESREQARDEVNTPTTENTPLTFELKLDQDHSYLEERKLTKQTIEDQRAHLNRNLRFRIRSAPLVLIGLAHQLHINCRVSVDFIPRERSLCRIDGLR